MSTRQRDSPARLWSFTVTEGLDGQGPHFSPIKWLSPPIQTVVFTKAILPSGPGICGNATMIKKLRKHQLPAWSGVVWQSGHYKQLLPHMTIEATSTPFSAEAIEETNPLEPVKLPTQPPKKRKSDCSESSEVLKTWLSLYEESVTEKPTYVAASDDES